jgi:hypothetical protein
MLTSIFVSSVAFADRKISITKPINTFSCESVRDNQCFFTVRGTATGLEDGDYISVLLQLAGGKEWWQGGNSVRYRNGSKKNSWTISMISVDPSSEFKNYVATAIVTRKPLLSGKKYSDLPSYLVSSVSYDLSLKKTRSKK